MDRTIAVWFVNETPVRLVWRGRRYRVNDVPTPLRPEDVWHPAITHLPPTGWLGWRFQAIDTDGAAVVFDIKPAIGADGWIVLAVHDYSHELVRH